ncbi:DNA repair-recombination protein (RAD50) isoform 1 [Theobroma cacao]|uniref:DNA repair protein RAD50 n=1 Tax=Theobroma cacao TaxID=3641 RepID=A0A061EJW6_THECC|nr:DNA repair-recombination protein (RAD50) isoform 1 [Theobroma cacao]
MSTVDKMLIKGIRSFDPENKNVITFFKPLTLIVGSNGAGKTTIIECLKLSCTGELPPNARSGHSFIHDPKVAGETETKGQIKLRFKTAAGKDVVCIRSFQLTQKASKMEYKAIESVLQTINPHTGEKVCLSYRCADMDREIPALMGVSKAILENVIFVHQDEANWPLQDPSTLKKKFDDIFSATRYTKALEVIKKLHKDQAQEVKAYKLKLEHLQTLKDAAYKLRESIAQDQEKTESLKSQIQDLEKNIDNLDAKIHNAEATLKDLRKLEDQKSTKTAERSTLFKEQQKQYAALAEENEDTDEELMEWKTKFDERIMLLENKIQKMESNQQDLNNESSAYRRKLETYIGEIGKLQRDAENLVVLKDERDSAIRGLYVKLNLGSIPNSPFSDEVALNLTNQIEVRLMELDKDLDEKKKSNEMKLKSAWDCYMGANDRWNSTEAQKKAKLEIKSSILKRLEEKKIDRDSLELQISDVNLSRIDEREKNMQIEIDRKKKQLDERNFDANIRQKQHEVYDIDQKIKVLNRERDIIAGDAEDRTLLSIKKSELENKKKQHKKIIDEYKDRIRGVLKGRVPTDKDLKREITKALRSLQMEFDELSTKSSEAEKEVNMLQMKIEEINNNLSKHHKDMDSRKRFLEARLNSLDQQSFTIDSYPNFLETAKEKKDIHKSKFNIADGMRQMFDPFERVARAHHICPCCERPFSAEEEDEFVKKQRVKAASSAEHMKVLAMESSNAESHFQQLDNLRMVYEEYVKIGKETIPLAEKTLHKLTEELDQKSQAHYDVLGVLAQVKTDKDSIETLVEPIETADRIFQEIQSLQAQVEGLEYKFDFRGQGTRTMEEIQLELNGLQSTRDVLHNEVEKLRDEQIFMEKDLSSIQLRWHDIREKKVEVANTLRDFKKAEEELEHLAEEKSQLDLEEKHLAEALSSLFKEKERLLKDYECLKVKLTQEYEQQDKSRSAYQHEAEALSQINNKIKGYYNLNKGEKLKELLEQQSVMESQLLSCDARKQEISAELNKSKDLMRNQDQLRRNIEDNLNYRKTKAEVDKLTREIDLLQERALEIGGISKFEGELRKISEERERLLSEINRCRGTMSVYQSNISKNKAELKQAQYKDIDKRYFDQLIQLKTTEMANKDLDRYYNALDKALMRFHSMKMEEINKIIRELWQQTYRGQDIDYISIHSDSEGAGTRSYSYKVVMQTGDAELEMRGRCSAGQKVLASLIIRLALAETFCLNCGILALDEPTTNLDGPNAESLAAALLRIMEDRKGQENFQLIVITHDERFAQLIGQRQHAERYYRVTKDDHQHSIIEAQEIFD